MAATESRQACSAKLQKGISRAIPAAEYILDSLTRYFFI
jgi:hypothetical protein